MTALNKYLVILKNLEDREEFLSYMTGFKSSRFIPERPVKIFKNKKISRNTYFYLTNEEAELVSQDPRVKKVQEYLDRPNAKAVPLGFEDLDKAYDRRNPTNNTQHNAFNPDETQWGLARHFLGGTSISQDGSRWTHLDTTNQTTTITTDVKIPFDGENVDVVIVDGFIDPNHPEFSDGNGGTRVVQYDWFLHAAEVGLDPSPCSEYVYGPVNSSSPHGDDNHGLHVASTLCGNKFGWARKANIYNINPFGPRPSNPNYNNNCMSEDYLFDLIRAWHNSKPINPSTGRPNPTIVNNSWGYMWQEPTFSIDRIRIRGVDIYNPTPLDLYDNKITVRRGSNNDVVTDRTELENLDPANYSDYYYLFEWYIPDMQEDIAQCIEDGIIMVGAAGNQAQYNAAPGDLDWDNEIETWETWVDPLHRGSSPASETIKVGNLDNFLMYPSQRGGREQTNWLSNRGPGVNVWAAGSNILGSVYSSDPWQVADDPRDSSYKLSYYYGTSMASPQVAGVLACMLQKYPRMSQEQALILLLTYGVDGMVASWDTGWWSTWTGGQYSVYSLDLLSDVDNNVGLKYPEVVTLDSGVARPTNAEELKPSTGLLYPRRQVYIR